MARMIKIETYDILSSQTGIKYINPDNVIEIQELLPSGGKALTRIKMSDGSQIDTQKNIGDTDKLING